jgi:hypothetical protein
MDLSEAGRQDETAAPRRSRKVSLALCIGVLLIPVLFVWFLMRPGYSTRSQVIGVAWLGAIGLTLLLIAPQGLLIKAPPGLGVSTQPRSWEVQAASDQGAGPSALQYKLAQTRSIYRMLLTSVTVTNNVGRDLKYVEVFCSYYDGKGTLLGYGMSNWATVGAGDTVTGEVVATGVAIDDVKRRECRARHL